DVAFLLLDLLFIMHTYKQLESYRIIRLNAFCISKNDTSGGWSWKRLGVNPLRNTFNFYKNSVKIFSKMSKYNLKIYGHVRLQKSGLLVNRYIISYSCEKCFDVFQLYIFQSLCM